MTVRPAHHTPAGRVRSPRHTAYGPTHHTTSGVLVRACFQLQVRPDRIDEYRARHAAVWPEMLRALAENGWHNYSLFLRADGLLIGYVETPSLEAAVEGMARTEVNARWQAEMAPFFEQLDGVAPDQGFLLLEEVFHLEDQLDQLDQLDAHPSDRSTPDQTSDPTQPRSDET